jgi:hypothetical protein
MANFIILSSYTDITFSLSLNLEGDIVLLGLLLVSRKLISFYLLSNDSLAIYSDEP